MSSIDDNFEERRKSALEKRLQFEKTAEKNFQGILRTLLSCLAVRAILEIEGITLPFMLVVLGPPGSAKTTILRMIASLPKAFSLDNLTSKSFVSHYAGASKETLDKNDLMTKIKDMVFLVLDLAPIFSGNDEKLREIIGILTSVLDGRGYKSISGVHGVREHGSTFFVMIGAAVDVSKSIWSLIAQLGPKMFFLRIDMQMSYEEEQKKIQASIDRDDYESKLKEVGDCLKEYWGAVMSVLAPNGGKIVWTSEKDDPSVKLRIIEYAQLLARLRGYVATDKTENTGGSNYGYTDPIIEDPSRAARYLLNLAKGSAVCNCRNYITEEDLSVVRDVVLSSASKERIDLLKLLVKNGGQITTSQFMEQKKTTRATALKTMKQLEILGLVDETTVPMTTKYCKVICLKEQFRWILESKYI